MQGKHVIKDISRRFKDLFTQLCYELFGGGMWSWTWRSKNHQRHKIFGIFDCISETISIERQQTGLQIVSWFCHLHVASVQLQGGVLLPGAGAPRSAGQQGQC